MNDLEPSEGYQPFWGPNAKMMALQFALAFVIANTVWFLIGGNHGWFAKFLDPLICGYLTGTC
jgi:hypothetical protein